MVGHTSTKKSVCFKRGMRRVESRVRLNEEVFWSKSRVLETRLNSADDLSHVQRRWNRNMWGVGTFFPLTDHTRAAVCKVLCVQTRL